MFFVKIKNKILKKYADRLKTNRYRTYVDMELPSPITLRIITIIRDQEQIPKGLRI